MRILQAHAQICMDMLDRLNIQYGENIIFVVNSRAKTRWGQCKRTQGKWQISISSVLLEDRNSVEGLENTILHELLHTCPGCQNHGSEWKRLADKVNRAYGYTIKRTSTAKEKGLCEDAQREREEQRIKRASPQYMLVCQNCGYKYYRKKASKVVTCVDKYRCGKCHGFLKVEKMGG